MAWKLTDKFELIHDGGGEPEFFVLFEIFSQRYSQEDRKHHPEDTQKDEREAGEATGGEQQ